MGSNVRVGSTPTIPTSVHKICSFTEREHDKIVNNALVVQLVRHGRLKTYYPSGKQCGFESHSEYEWPNGGIGRHARLKIWCSKERVGSIPSLVTK